MKLKINNGILTAEEYDLDDYHIYWESSDKDPDSLHFLGSLKGLEEVKTFFEAWKKLDVNRTFK